MPVDSRMPVETAEEDRGQLARRLRIPVALENMGNLIGIFAVKTIKRQARKAGVGACLRAAIGGDGKCQQ